MSKPLTDQQLHNLAMNIVGKDLTAKGYEFIAVNSKLKKHPQFVCIDKRNQRYFVIVKSSIITGLPIPYDVIWMETFKKHAEAQNAKILFAGVGLGNVKNKLVPPNLNEEYLLQYDGLQSLDIELN
ncbi:MAG: Na(+)-translocating NADH-quinone reductase subunit F [Lutibacter sp.]|uniref:Na(+)-translocating NADH-quinone reductase subunit F n=1 Tax=Lutibacter sp. TaxID=1925666 RepID=UPI001857E6F4|nr:Na(+)-translocating NADH-quinone reductase subunit F [Lutibacter sp.]MBT8318161.1 Na(+)-translocating NADH-quinone reductase subunit F [Lutibacter sp.]NNJ59021.1 Na(+)-translocating NADH-quinone reductase subunit F [Lutibacter sp.]